MSETTMLAKVLKAAVQKGASDVHAKAGDVFRARINGKLVGLTKQRLTPAQTRAIAATFAGLEMDDPRLDTMRDYDGSWGVPGVGRFRVNVLRQRSSFMVVMRVIPFSIPTIEGLNLPEAVSRLAELPRGLVIVTGLAGSGVTSTIAAMVHHINQGMARHIITIEDPIEYLHRDLGSSITQREVGSDTTDVTSALQAAMRQDPDVLVLSDLHQAETVDRAIRAAEAGLLVIGALRVPDVVQALLQLTMVTPPEEREVVRMRLGGVLRGVIAQRLVEVPDEDGRRPQVEWVEVTAGLATAIGAGAEALPLRKLVERAVKDGMAEIFPKKAPD